MRCARSIAANLLILFVLWANVATVLNYPLYLWSSKILLPLPAQVYDAFLLFGVFSHYEVINRDIELYGITPATAEDPEGTIVPLVASDYLPFQRGPMQSRTYVLKHGYSGGLVGQQMALADLAAKIRGRYNREHVERPIARLVIVEVTWPRAFRSYEALKSNESLRVLYSE